jgi:4-hydroxyphenylpyruvate dioxygenase-like putative hemolysin
MTSLAEQKLPEAAPARFSHLHLYVDSLESLDHYKTIEAQMNQFSHALVNEKDCVPSPVSNGIDITKGREVWKQISGSYAPDDDRYVSQNQDIVNQLICGSGWRIIAEHDDTERITSGTRSYALSSSAENGVRFVVTARGNKNAQPSKRAKTDEVTPRHFQSSTIDHFFGQHAERQGIAVLGFEVDDGGIETIRARYASKHPSLIVPGAPFVYAKSGNFKILEVYAYYKGDVLTSPADTGTILRFIERPTDAAKKIILPSFTNVKAEYSSSALDFPAYMDHWVSNVISRQGFLQTLEDGLGFTPQVEFNAGVVAAGEARIESTVTGNKSATKTSDPSVALTDQSQIYLPINNALSEVGHVHWFLQELGQGVQHVASRVSDIIGYIQRVNDYRKMTGQGFTFLNIPRSYYGVLSNELFEEKSVPSNMIPLLMAALRDANVIDYTGIVVDLNVSEDTINHACSSVANYNNYSKLVCDTVLLSRYVNLHKLLGDQIEKETYLCIVRNKILVDVQAGDLLYQIFTSTILQREVGQEAPFLEFIQRVCSCKTNDDGSCKPIKPGCGGFGIRNFLTLFLSIEVSKAMNDVADFKKKNDEAGAQKAQECVRLLTDQLNESNPILTQISDAMTREGELRDEAAAAISKGENGASLLEEAKKFQQIKDNGNILLQECSAKYGALMKELREK